MHVLTLGRTLPSYRGSSQTKLASLHHNIYSSSLICCSQRTYKHLYDKVRRSLDRLGIDPATFGLPHPAPQGYLFANLKNATNDHAGVEKTRVNHLEAAIRILIGDPNFELNRGEYTHHKLGLIAEKIEKTCNSTMIEILGSDIDTSIREV